MIRLLPLSVSVALLASLSSAWASPAELRKLEALFERTFISGYEMTRCRDNILGLLDRAQDEGIRAGSAEIITIENRGGSVFGMVNAEQARLQGNINRDRRPGEPSHFPGEANWYFHVILVFEGLVFDFDFTNDPTVLPVREYFERMFLDENPRPTYGFNHAGRDRKLDEYELTISTAADYYRYRADRNFRPAERKMRLRRYLGY